MVSVTLQKGTCILLYQESKGPARAYPAEIIHVEDNKAKIALFHPQEEFRILSVELNDRILTGPRETYLELRDPNPHEKKSIARMRETVLARLTDAERRRYENPDDNGKRKRMPPSPEKIVEVKPKTAKRVPEKKVKKAVKNTMTKRKKNA